MEQRNKYCCGSGFTSKRLSGWAPGTMTFLNNHNTEKHPPMPSPTFIRTVLPAGHHRDCHSSTCPEVAYQAAWPAGSSGAQHICPPQLAWPEPALQQGWLPGSGSKKEVSPAGTCGVVTSSSLPGPSWPMVSAGAGRMYLPRQEREACELCPSLLSPQKSQSQGRKGLGTKGKLPAIQYHSVVRNVSAQHL